MTVKIAINGFGRIGRNVCKAALEQDEIEIVAVNDLTDADTLAHLLKYDSVHGTFPGTVEVQDGLMHVNDKAIKIFAEKDPSDLPWEDLGIDIVVESTGLFTAREKAEGHLKAGAKKVVISAPGKNEDITIVMSVNEEKYDSQKHDIISNASCTTNCLAPIAKVLNDVFGIKRGFMTTVHSYTNDQRILDLPHKEKRRARAAALSIIPTSSGAAKAVDLVLPELKGKLNGFAMRVPTPNVSVVDFVAELAKNTTVAEVNQALKEASENKMQGILGYTEEPLVSKDYYGDSRSSIVDGLCTMLLEGNMVKVIAWYDNEWGYSCRVVDLVKYIEKGL